MTHSAEAEQWHQSGDIHGLWLLAQMLDNGVDLDCWDRYDWNPDESEEAALIARVMRGDALTMTLPHPNFPSRERRRTQGPSCATCGGWGWHYDRDRSVGGSRYFPRPCNLCGEKPAERRTEMPYDVFVAVLRMEAGLYVAWE